MERILRPARYLIVGWTKFKVFAFRESMKTAFMLSCAFLMGCEAKLLQLTPSTSTSITGLVKPIASQSGMSITTLACTSATASIYKLSGTGAKILPAIQTVALSSDGSYTFSNVKSLGISVENKNQINGNYIVEVSGCNNSYARFLTSTDSQDITWGSTLLSFLTNTPQSQAVTTAAHSDVGALMNKLSNYSDFSSAYIALSSNATLSNEFQSVFGFSPSILQNASPLPVNITAPTQFNEGEATSLSITATHWSPTYNYAYLWVLDGTTIASTNNTSFTPTANSQGNHTLSIYWGQKDGSGNFDQTKPFQSQSFQIMIANTLPAVPPNIAAVSSNVNTTLVTLQIATGASKTNCATFSKLAITEDVPTAPTQGSDYTYTCSQAPTQNITYNLGNGTGTHTLYLWAMDAAGNISTSPKTTTVTYSLNVPSIAITTPAISGAYAQSIVTVGGTCDSSSGDVTLTGDFTGSPALTACNSGNFSKSITLSGADGAKNVSAAQTNLFGNTGTTSITITKDNSIGSFSSLAINPSSPGNNTKPTITGSTESLAIVEMYSLPSCLGSILADGAAATNGSFSLTPASSVGADGNYSFSVKATDLAGNTVCSSNVVYVLDTTQPTVTLSSTASDPTNTSPIPVTAVFSEDVTGFALADISVGNGSASGLTGSGTNYSFNVTPSGQGAVTVTIPANKAQDGAGNVNTASNALSRTYDSVAPALTITAPTANQYFNSTSITVSGACETGRTITVSGSGVSSPSSATCTAAAYSFAMTLTSGDGTKNMSLSQTDAAGNTTTVTRTVNLDTVVPVLTFTSAAIKDQITNTNTVTYTGTCETGLSVVVAGGVDSSSATCTGGAWTYTTAIQASDASRSYTFTQTDAASNATSITGTWLRDVVVPTLTLTSPSGGYYKNGSSISITWTSTDLNFGSNPITIEYSSNGGSSWSSLAANQTNSGSYSWTAPAFNSNTMKVRIKSVDTAGNTATAISSTFAIDSTPPVVNLTSLTGGQTIRGGVNYTVTWTATDTNMASSPVTIEYSSNDGSTWTSVATGLSNSGSYTWSVPSVNGNTYQIRISASDLSGNIGQAASTSSFTIDSAAPTVNLTSHTGGQTIPGNGASSTITWTASDDHLGSNPVKIEYSSNGGSTWSTVATGLANSGSYAWTVPTPDTSTGRIKITVTDQVGNAGSSSSSSNFTIASTAPVITQTTLASGYSTNSLSAVTFGGACTNGLTIDVVKPDSSTTTTTCSTGTWSWTTPTQSSDGTYTYYFSQTNVATLTTTVAGSWTKDTSAPTITAFYINNLGDTVTANNGVNLTVTTGEATSGLKIRFAIPSPDCTSAYVDNGWLSQNSATTTTAYSLTIGDGPKSVCAWAKDSAGNISSASTASISLSSGTPPTITAFAAVNSSGSVNDGTTNYYSGEQVKITWTATDAEGLSNTPITLSYTTDGSTWTTITQNYGSASGNPTTYTDTYYWTAPSSGFFRLKMSVKDSVGNTSFPVLSKTMNTGNWFVTAGTTDRGLGGKANRAILNRYGSSIKHFAIHPKTGDIYAFDYQNGLNKIDAKTGIVTRFITDGNNNLPSNGTLSASSRVPAYGNVAFDSNGLLYVLSPGSSTSSSSVYQINLDTNTVKLYLGGSSASVYDNTATPLTAFVFYGDMVFDESNSLYFWTHCAAGAWNTSNAMRMMKVTQTSGNADTVSVVAGNCSHGTITSGTAATSSPISTAGTANGIFGYSTMAAWNNGNTIYFQLGDGSPVRKILNGNIYSTTATCTGNIASAGWGLAYNSSDQKLYMAAGPICKVTPSTSGANGETTVSHITTTYTNGCTADGLARTSACVHSQAAIAVNAQGNIVFVDQADWNANRPYTLRYIDSTDKIRTLAGTLSFYGDGLDALFARGNFGSIYYKKTTESNQSAFPSGLYFMEISGPVLGYIDSSNVVHSLAGNQFGNNVVFANGTDMSMDMSLGSGAYGALTFTSSGLPAFRYYNVFGGFDANKKFVQYQSAGGTDWSWFSVGSSPKTAGLYSFGGQQNLTMKDQQLFLLGVRYYATDPTPTPNPVMRIFDFTNNIIKHVMGGTGTTSSADSVVTGSLASSSISSACQQMGCAQQFIENDSSLTSDDMLYFSEGAKLRVIFDPTTPSNHFLSTIFTATATIQNFIVSQDQTQVFYLMGGKLYCHDIPTTPSHTAKSWCNDSNLGPPTGMTTITKAPNQMTWMDSTSLLISTGAGEIYQYNLLP